MLIYEKNNKLNISFDNELDNPDIEIGKGEINVDGNNIVNGGGGVFIVTDTNGVLDKTWTEISNADENCVVKMRWENRVYYLTQKQEVLGDHYEVCFGCVYYSRDVSPSIRFYTSETANGTLVLEEI